MSGSAVLAVRVVGDVADARRGLKDVDRASDKTASNIKSRFRNLSIAVDTRKARRDLNDVDQASEKTAGKVKGHFRNMAGGVAKAFAGVAILDFVKDSVAAYTEAADGEAKFLNAMKRVPGITKPATQALEDQATALSQVTTFDDDVTKSGQAVLAGFGLTAAQVKTVTPLLQDYATKTGKELPLAARDLGKALNGSSGPLKKIGLDFKGTGDKTRDFGALTDALRSKVGGLARTAGGTAAGKVAILKNQFGEVKEAVGAKLVPVLVLLGGILLNVVNFVQDNIDWLGPLAGAIGGVVAVVKIWSAVQRILNFVLAANPVLLIAAAIVGLVALIVLAYRNSETFRNVVKSVFSAILAPIRFVSTALSHVPEAFESVVRFAGRFAVGIIRFIEAIPTRIAQLATTVYNAGVRFIGGLFRGIGNAAKGAAGFAENIAKTVVNTLVRGINTILNLPWKLDFDVDIPGLPDVHVGPYTLLPAIPLWSSAHLPPADVPDVATLLPGFTLMADGVGPQFGGKVPVVPASGGDGAPTVVHRYEVTVEGMLVDPDGAARAIEELLRKRRRRGGGE